jgi:hypothetical protein
MSRPSKTIILPENFDFEHVEYTVHVRHHGRWVQASSAKTLSEAESMADAAHRRSDLPVEIRDAQGLVVLAFEPPSHVVPRECAGVEFV